MHSYAEEFDYSNKHCISKHFEQFQTVMSFAAWTQLRHGYIGILETPEETFEIYNMIDMKTLYLLHTNHANGCN